MLLHICVVLDLDPQKICLLGPDPDPAAANSF
jgi:hypothetical protein